MPIFFVAESVGNIVDTVVYFADTVGNIVEGVGKAVEDVVYIAEGVGNNFPAYLIGVTTALVKDTYRIKGCQGAGNDWQAGGDFFRQLAWRSG